MFGNCNPHLDIVIVYLGWGHVLDGFSLEEDLESVSRRRTSKGREANTILPDCGAQSTLTVSKNLEENTMLDSVRPQICIV